MVVNDEGVKLSKQNLAASLDRNPVQINLINALKWLGLEAPTSLFKRKNSDQILTWAINNWQRNNIACEEKKQQTYNSYDV